MKLAGTAGTGTGKLGSQVYSTVAGQQIVRVYNPKIANPSTSAQVEQRGRMKLMSQISAAMSSVIAMRKQGLKSPRNMFAKKNFNKVFAAEGETLAFLESFKLTDGSAVIPRCGMKRLAGNKLSLFMQSSAAGSADRIVYNLFARNEEGELMLIQSKVATDTAGDGTFTISVDDYESDLYLYAYGIKFLNERAKAKYGDYKVQSGEDVAKLLMSRSLVASDYSLTDTSGNSITIDDDETIDVPEGSVLVRCTIIGDGVIRNNTANGAVVQTPLVKVRGSHLKWYAVPAPDYNWSHWECADIDLKAYYDQTFSFSVWEDVEIVAVFNPAYSNTGGNME